MAPQPLATSALHQTFLQAMGDAVLHHGDVSSKPLHGSLKPPLPQRVRLYLYNVTHPPGGRTLGEHKIQLIVPGQSRGETASFDHSSGHVVLLCGYEQELGVFVLWDAYLYPTFTYSRNVQVDASTVIQALVGQIARQERHLAGGHTETVLAAIPQLLIEAIELRVRLTTERIAGAPL